MYLSNNTVLTTFTSLKGSQRLNSKPYAESRNNFQRFGGRLSEFPYPSLRLPVSWHQHQLWYILQEMRMLFILYYWSINHILVNWTWKLKTGQIICYVARMQLQNGKHCGLYLLYFLLPEYGSGHGTNSETVSLKIPRLPGALQEDICLRMWLHLTTSLFPTIW